MAKYAAGRMGGGRAKVVGCGRGGRSAVAVSGSFDQGDEKYVGRADQASQCERGKQAKVRIGLVLGRAGDGDAPVRQPQHDAPPGGSHDAERLAGVVGSGGGAWAVRRAHLLM